VVGEAAAVTLVSAVVTAGVCEVVETTEVATAVLGGSAATVDEDAPSVDPPELPHAAALSAPMRSTAVAFPIGGDCMGTPARIRREAVGFTESNMEMVPTMRALVEKTIEVIRPALQADGGDIVLRDVNEETGVVSVTLIGACGTCPASTQTLKSGIERIMRDRVDGVTEVINVED
jgi:Fe-S cluster biogenesis protein NfuA